jgi:opacity protein-like surface antigen
MILSRSATSVAFVTSVVHVSVLLTLLCLEATSARAAEGPDYARPGPYLQAAGVQGFGHFGEEDVSSRPGLNLAIGGRFTRYIAAELDFEGVINWELAGRDSTTYAVMANAKAYYPIRRIQPFVLAGIGTLITEHGNDHKARFAGRLGGGFDLFVTDSIYLSLSYRYTGNFDNVGYSSILYGVGYHFD